MEAQTPTFVLYKSRHPLVGSLAGQELPALFKEKVNMKYFIDDFINPDDNLPLEPCRVKIVVTGLTPCLIYALEWFWERGCKVTLLHFDRATNDYWEQKVPW